MMLMARHTPEAVNYAPLYIHSFRLVQPHTLVEAEKFNIRYTDPSQITSTADKLRWYRYRKGLLQRDVADYVGMDRSTYSSYEEAGRDYYPIERMKKIAELFDVPIEMLLDEYNLFLYRGQSSQIKKARKARKMTQAQYAKWLDVSLGNLKKLERDEARISKISWQKIIGQK